MSQAGAGLSLLADGGPPRARVSGDIGEHWPMVECPRHGTHLINVDNHAVSAHDFDLVADVSSADPAAIEPVLRRLIDGEVTPIADGFHVVATLSGESAQDLNRSLLSSLRQVERRTRLRAAWTSGGATERFFDYVPKGTRTALS